MMRRSSPVLDMRDLRVDYGSPRRPVHAVRDVSLQLERGEALGLIGESGSGKSTIAFAIMRHLGDARIVADRLAIDGQDILALGHSALAALRGAKVAMVYQDPMSALNPLMRVGEQVAEVVRHHLGLGRTDAAARAETLLARVHLPNPAMLARRFPHELSGGQQQRIVIAMAIACDPALLILDEPTTGLDVTTEAVILDLIRELRRDSGVSVLLISHNLAVVSAVCDRLAVLYAGEVMETGPVDAILERPSHPYTARLIEAIPERSGGRLAVLEGHLPDLRDPPAGCVFRDRCEMAVGVCATHPALALAPAGQQSRCHRRSEVTLRTTSRQPWRRPPAVGAAPRLLIAHLSKSYDKNEAPALDDVSLDLPAGRTLAVVGESGSGKTTLARLVAGLSQPDAGTIAFEGEVLAGRVENRLLHQREAIQLVFQNPESALNPRRRAADIVARPLWLYGRVRPSAIAGRVRELFAAVKLADRTALRRPRSLSGGEKQRVGIARAFAAAPKLVVCDEPTSALDVSVQASILNELADLQASSGTSYLFISHDLGVVRHLADTVAVLYLGRLVEVGPVEAVFGAPRHPYTEALLASRPSLERTAAPATPLPAPAPRPARGCIFQARCPRRIGTECDDLSPPMRGEADHQAACHLDLAPHHTAGEPELFQRTLSA